MAHLFAKYEVTNNDKRNEGHTDMIVMDLQMDKKQYERITDTICDTGKEAVFSIDLISGVLYRIVGL